VLLPIAVPTPTPAPVPSVQVVTPSPVPIELSNVVLNPSVNEVFDFVSSLVSSLIWPAVVVFLFLVFRAPIKKILVGLSQRVSKIKRLTGPGGVGIEFEDEVEDVAERTRDFPNPTPEELIKDAEQVAQSARNIPLELAKIDPAVSIVAAFIPVEEAVRDYVKARGHDVSRRSPISFVRRDEELPGELRAVLLDMSAVRNAAAHHREIDISFESARAYIESAERVAHQIRVITAKVEFGFPIVGPGEG
jgi:hypothetical protein